MVSQNDPCLLSTRASTGRELRVYASFGSYGIKGPGNVSVFSFREMRANFFLFKDHCSSLAGPTAANSGLISISLYPTTFHLMMFVINSARPFMRVLCVQCYLNKMWVQITDLAGEKLECVPPVLSLANTIAGKGRIYASP